MCRWRKVFLDSELFVSPHLRQQPFLASAPRGAHASAIRFGAGHGAYEGSMAAASHISLAKKLTGPFEGSRFAPILFNIGRFFKVSPSRASGH